jgi:hypothetical protein
VFAPTFVTGFGIDWGTTAVVSSPSPLSGRPSQQYVLAGILVLIGIALFLITMPINEQTGVRGPGITDPTHLAEAPD